MRVFAGGARRQANPRFRNDRQFRSNPTNNGSLGAGALPRSDLELPGVISSPGPLSYKRLSKNGPNAVEKRVPSPSVHPSFPRWFRPSAIKSPPQPPLLLLLPPRRAALFQLQSEQNYRYNVRCRKKFSESGPKKRISRVCGFVPRLRLFSRALPRVLF